MASLRSQGQCEYFGNFNLSRNSHSRREPKGKSRAVDSPNDGNSSRRAQRKSTQWELKILMGHWVFDNNALMSLIIKIMGRLQEVVMTVGWHLCNFMCAGIQRGGQDETSGDVVTRRLSSNPPHLGRLMTSLSIFHTLMTRRRGKAAKGAAFFSFWARTSD